MVRRLAQFITSEVKGLHEAAYILGVFALLSQFLALVRDRIFASTFGADEVLDLYYAAFKIPDLLFVSIASFVSIYVLIPVISDTFERDQVATRRTIDTVFTVFFAALALVSAGVWFFLPQFLAFLFPGFTPDQVVVAASLSAIMLLQPILLGLSNLLASITQLKGRFLLYAVSPLLYNTGIIFGALVLYPAFGLSGLAWGVVLGAVLHLLVQVPFITKTGLLPRLTVTISWSTIIRVVKLSLPRTMTLASNQLLLLAFLSVASLLSVGSISVMQFAFNLQSVPLSVIGVSYSVAAFPTLAKLFSEGNQAAFVAQIIQAMRAVIFWSLPVIVLVVVLRAQIVRVILGSGEFDWYDTRLVAAALALFVVSLLAQALVMLLVRGFYAAGNTRTPLIANLVSVICSLAIAGALIYFYTTTPGARELVESLFRVEGLVGTTVLMLPLAYSLGLCINMILLLWLFERSYGNLRQALFSLVVKSSVASLTAGVIAYWLLQIFDGFMKIDTFLSILAQGALAGIGGLLTWGLLLRLMKSQELHEVWLALTHKFWKERPVVPEEPS